MPLLVSEIMHTDLVTISPELRLHMIKRLMEENGIRHVPVVEEEKLIGIVSDRDVKRHMSASIDTPRERPESRMTLVKSAAEIMTPDPFTVGPDTPVSDVLTAMIDRKFGAIPVVDAETRPIGIVTTIDFLRLLRDKL